MIINSAINICPISFNRLNLNNNVFNNAVLYRSNAKICKKIL